MSVIVLVVDQNILICNLIIRRDEPAPVNESNQPLHSAVPCDTQESPRHAAGLINPYSPLRMNQKS